MTSENGKNRRVHFPEWCFFLPWEEDEILATYIIPRVESVARARQWLWHEGRCYFGLAPIADDIT